MTDTKTGGEYRDYGYSDHEASMVQGYLFETLENALRILKPGARVLEAGCGNGWFAGELDRWGFETCAFDLSKTGIEQAQGTWPAVDFKIASVYDDLVTQFGRVDAVVSIEVIEHLYDPRTFVRRIHDVLDKEGLFILTTPYHGYLKNLLLAATGRLDQHFSALWDGGHIKFWSRATLTQLLVESGFEVVQFRGAGRLPYLWKSMVVVARRRC